MNFRTFSQNPRTWGKSHHTTTTTTITFNSSGAVGLTVVTIFWNRHSAGKEGLQVPFTAVRGMWVWRYAPAALENKFAAVNFKTLKNPHPGLSLQ